MSEPNRHSSAAAMDSQPLRDELSRAQAELHRELQVVGEIQRSLLPERLPDIPGYDLASYYKPSAMAGGDYFDVVPLVEGKWGLVMADVAGHGASAAVIMAVMRALIHAHLPYTKSIPAHSFLEFINQQMTDVYTRDGRFVTVWCAMLDPAARSLSYCSAGHNPARLVRRGSVISLDAAHGLPLGIIESEVYNEVLVTLESGDLVAIYTDGITEAKRAGSVGRDFFETERLDEALLASASGSAQDCVRRVADAVNDFAGSHVHADDQTMLVLRVI